MEMPQPRWSTLTLQHVTCTVPSGRIQADFVDDDNIYSMTATCPAGDVASHAAYLWEISIGDPSSNATAGTNDPWFISCRMDVRVRIGNVLPFTYTHHMEWSEEDNAQQEREVTKQDHPWPRLVVHEWGPTTLQVGLPLVLWDEEDPPKILQALELLVPAVTVLVRKQSHEGVDGGAIVPALEITMPKTTAHWKATDKKNEMDSSVTSMHELVFYITCQEATMSTEHCPWYRPITSTLFGSGFQNDTTIDTTDPHENIFGSRLTEDSNVAVSISHLNITVDGQDSFLETVLGQQHMWTVKRTTAPDLPPVPFGLDQEFRQQDQSQRRLRSTPAIQEAASNCLQVSDGIQMFDIAMCLLVNVSDSNQGNIVAVANMTFYQTSLAGAAISEWVRDSQTLDLYARSVIDDAKSSLNPRINATGKLHLETYSLDTEIDADLVNEGSWYPMIMSLLTNGTAVNDVLDLTLHDANVFLDGQDYLTGATGSFSINIDQLILQASLQDPTYQVSVAAEFLEDEIVPLRENPYAPPTPSPTLRPTQVGTGPDEPVNFTSVDVFRGDCNILKNGVYIWNNTWFGEFWDYNYDEYFSSPDDFSSVYSDIMHSFLYLDWKETVKDIQFETRAIDRNHYGNFNNATTFESGTTEDFENIKLEYIRFRWGSTQYLNMSVDLYIDAEAQSFDLKAQDSARLDFIGGVGVSWLSQDTTGDDIVMLEYWNATNFAGSKPYALMQPGMFGTFIDDGVRGNFSLVSSADSWLQMNATFGYTWDELERVFLTSIDNIAVGWRGDAFTDFTGTFTLGTGGEYCNAVLRDVEVAEFFTNFSVGWYSSSTSEWGFLIDKALLEIASEVGVDSTASFRYCDICTESNFNPYGVFYIDSSAVANMKMDMDMDFTWVEDDEYLQVVMDHFRMVWKDTVYVEAGIEPLSAVAPSTDAPTASPSSGATPDVSTTAPPTSFPTSTPTTAPNNPTGGPTDTPTSTPTALPVTTDTEESYEITGITMRLQDGQEMSPTSVVAFEAAVKSFYLTTYASSSEPNQRRLQTVVTVTSFDTTVKVTDQSVDETGSTVSYDQNVTFFPAQGVTLSSDDVQDLIEVPLVSGQGRKDFLQVLQNSVSSFENVTQVDQVTVPLPVAMGTDRDVDPTSLGVRAFSLVWVCASLCSWVVFY